MRARLPLFEIFAISLAAIVLEISYTRILSFKLSDALTHLLIGVGLLGLAAGGVWISVSMRLRQMEAERLVASACIAGSAAVLVGYWIVALLPVDATRVAVEPLALLRVALLALALFVPYVAVGVAIATILGARPAAAGPLYAADRAGAGLGCAASLPLVAWLSPPSAVLVSGLVLLAAAWPAMRRREQGYGEWAALGTVYAALAFVPGALPAVAPDASKSLAAHPRAPGPGIPRGGSPGAPGARFSQWSPLFRVDVTRPAVAGAVEDAEHLVLHYDGQRVSALQRFDGDLSALAHLEADPRALPFSVLAEAPRVLVIGSAGGREILASLHFGAREVVGVALDPVTLSLLTDVYADFTGRLHEHERVTMASAGGRFFLKASDRRYDLIWLAARDSRAAMNAASTSAYVLPQSYLYTVEMLHESLARLAPGGVLCAQLGESDADDPLRATRLLATAREALRGHGVSDLERHALVATAPDVGGRALSTVLLRPAPFDRDEAARFRAAVARVRGGVARHAGGRRRDPSRLAAVIELPQRDLERWLERAPYELGPVRDDAPYSWHFARFRDVLASSLLGETGETSPDPEGAATERGLLALLALCAVFAAVALLLPFVLVRPVFAAIPYKLPAGLYFAALGTGFMLLEVSLIQRFVLFLGHPTRSLSVTLCSLLVFSGLGSLATTLYAGRRNRALGALAAALVGLMLLHQLALPALLEHSTGASLALRALAAVGLIAPLGLCLGALLPLGLLTVSALTGHKRDYVAWCWAVSGLFAVLGSALAALLAMSFGFAIVQLGAVVVTLLGIGALARVPAPPAPAAARGV